MTMEQPPSGEMGGDGGGEPKQNPLTKKLGPLPVWGWALAIGGGFILFRIVRGQSAFPSAGGTSTQVGAVTQPIIPGTETSALGMLSASDMSALRDALTNPEEAKQEAAQTSTLATLKTAVANLQTAVNKIPVATSPSPAPSTSAPPATTVSFAGTYSPFGTKYPDYVKTYADAVAWINRALKAGYKPKASTNISQTPHTTWPY